MPYIFFFQLFLTNEQITYTLLSDKLNQTPELGYRKEAYYTPIIDFEPPDAESHEFGEKINGGLYSATYFINGIEANISFIENNGEYIALYTNIKEMN